jgi:YD repeat-containing protein
VATPVSSKQFDQYDAAGNLSHFSDSSGVNAIYSPDAFNQVESESVSATGSLSNMSLSATHGYDKNGNETTRNEIQGAFSNLYTSTYDGRNNLKTFTQAGLGTTNYDYDNNANVKVITDPAGRNTNFDYDSRNLISSLTSGTGTGAGSNSFTYDGNGNLSGITDAMGRQTTMAYDGFDRVKSVKDPLNNETVISHAQFGNLLTVKRLDSEEILLGA